MVLTPTDQVPGRRGKAGQLDRLQFLRGFAALIVLLSHMDGFTIGFPGRAAGFRGGISDWFEGSFGVDIFFVLSGFIMFYTCQDRFGSASEWKIFLWRRLARIAPLYWALTIAESAILYASRIDGPERQISAAQFIKSMLFIPYDWHSDKFRPLLGPGWSLSYEMFFYALFASVLFLPMRKAMLMLMAIFATLLCLGFVVPPSAVLLAFTRPLLLEFIVGAAIAVLYLYLRDRNALPRLGQPMLIVIGLIAAQRLWGGGNEGLSDWDWPDWLLAAAIVATASLAADPIRRNLLTRAMRSLGDASYSIYLVHVIVLALWQKAWITLLPTGGIALACFLLLGVALTITCGWLIHIYFERPVTDWFNNRMKAARRPAMALGSPQSSEA